MEKLEKAGRGISFIEVCLKVRETLQDKKKGLPDELGNPQ